MKTTRVKHAVSIYPVYASVALLCAGALMQAVAQTSVMLYGTVDNAFTYSSNQGGHSDTYINPSALLISKFGLYGTEDLGGGNTTLFWLESGLNVATGQQSQAGVVFNRQTCIGLSNTNYGQVTLGRAYASYFQYVASLGPTNALIGATGARPGDVDTLDATLRFSNSVTYTTPALGGLQAGVQYGFGKQAGNISNDSSASARLRYDFQAFSWGVGYTRLKNVSTGTTAGNFSNVGTLANNSPVNAGYAAADSAQLIATAARYTLGKLMVGLDYSNVQYKPGALSLFTQSATFNTVGAIATYDPTPALQLAFGCSYTAKRARNGINSPAKYNQLSMEQLYSLSKYTAFYAIQAYQRANSQTPRASRTSTSIVDAVASVSDSQNGAPSNGRSQFVSMIDIRYSF